jgi:hypothetical protein
MMHTPDKNVGPVFMQLLILISFYSLAVQSNGPALRDVAADGKGDASKALAQALQEKVFYIHMSFSFYLSPHSPKSVVIVFLSMNCVLVKCSIFYLLCSFSSSMESMSGCSIVAFIAAGRKTFIGEKCECSSSKENGGAPKKLITGNFSEVFVSGTIIWFCHMNVRS